MGQAMPVSAPVAHILPSKENAMDIFAQNDFTQQQLEEFIQLAKKGNVTAQYIVGFMYFKSKGVKVNARKGMEFYRLAANQGHMLAQFNVGLAYSRGVGFPKNKRKAFKYFLLAANQGDMSAQFYVGLYLEEGQGVKQDHTKAFEYYLKSANQGCTGAHHNIGLCYTYGRGVSQDYQKALEYLQIAAAKGFIPSNVSIGWIYNQKQEYDKAMEYYLQASEEGNAVAYKNIGVLYELGQGVAVDYNRAVSFYRKAAEKGDKWAVKNVELLMAKIPQTKTLPSKTEDWTVDDVVAWMSSLNLSQSYRELIQDNHLTGKALLTMKMKEDWQELGVTKFGDLRVLINTPITGGNVVPAVNAESPIVINGFNNRLAQTEGLDDVVYKPITKLVGGDYRPPHSCHDHVLADLPSVLIGVSTNIPSIISECVKVAESRLQHVPSHIPKLSADESLAIALYSYDLGSKDTHKNPYHILNRVMRERDPHKMEKLKPFLSYLMNGLSKLPPLQATVYRGIPNSSMKLIQDNYRAGVSVHWSGFTSATTNINKAKDFALKHGIIFRIKVLTGRSIKHYSSFPSEDEVLLSPNIKLLVTSGVGKGTDGFHYLDLAEQLDNPLFVF